MRSKNTLFIVLLVVLSTFNLFKNAVADIKFPLILQSFDTNRTSSSQFAQGLFDYYKMINERDGGIGGLKIIFPKCQIDLKVMTDLECYQTHKSNAVAFNSNSTNLSNNIILNSIRDQISIITTGDGKAFFKNGRIFKWVFNLPANNLNGASIAIRYILKSNLGNIKGKKISYIFYQGSYGENISKFLSILSKKYGFKLISLPTGYDKEQEIWSKIKKNKPDYILVYGSGIINSNSIKLISSINFPIKNLIGIHWSEPEENLIKYGDYIDSYKALTFTNSDINLKIYKYILNYVYKKNNLTDKPTNFGTVNYNRGLFQGMVNVEAALMAQKFHGNLKITASMFHSGMENLIISNKRLEELGFKKFIYPFKNNCSNHGGSGLAAIQQWNSKKKSWEMITNFMYGEKEIINKFIEQDSINFAKVNKIISRCD